MSDIMNEIERPPSKNNLSVYSIIQLIIMLYLGCDAGKEVFDLFKAGGFSFVGLLKIVIDGLIFVGMLVAAYGLFGEKSDSLKIGFALFFYGCLGLLIVWVLDLLRDGFGWGHFVDLLVICFISYVLYVQIPQI